MLVFFINVSLGLTSSFLGNRRPRVVLDGKASQEYPVNARVQGFIIGPTIFLLYINELPDDVICDITVYADDTTVYSMCDQTSDLWQQLKLASTWIWSARHCGLGQVVALLILMLRKLNWFRLTGLITLVLLMWKWMVLFLRKNHLSRCSGWPSLLNWIGTLHYLHC